MTSRSGESTENDLESTVKQQQERINELERTVKKMMPSRRDMLKGGAVAGVGLLGFGAGQASADGHSDGDTQWGGGSNRDDYFVDYLNANAVDTGNPKRNIASNQDRTITVGQDVNTIQEALDQIPIFLQHFWTIDIPSGDYTTEFPVVPPAVVQTEASGDQQNGGIHIQGDSTTPSNVKVGGLLSEGTVGKRAVIVDGIELTDEHPESDGSSLQVNEPGVCIVRDCNFTNAGAVTGLKGVQVYGGAVQTKGTVDFGTDNYKQGVVVKNNGSFKDAQAALQGSTTGAAYWEQTAVAFITDSNATLSGSPTYRMDSTQIIEQDGSTNQPTPNTMHGFRSDYPSEVAASRAFGSWYQNTADVPLYVSASGIIDASGATMQLILHINSSQNNQSADMVDRRSGNANEVFGVAGTVPPGGYYKVAAAGNTADFSLNRWHEYKIGGDI